MLTSDLGELAGSSHHDVGIDSELGLDETLDGGGHGCRRALRAPEQDVAALQVRDHVREPGIRERGAEVPHRDAVDTAEIDRAEERKEDHAAIVASTASGREV